MTPQEARIMMNKIRDNRDKLDNCKAHNFGDVPLPFTFGMKFTCANCGGEMKAVDAFRYIQGFEAAGGNPNKVLQGYRPDWKPQQLQADWINRDTNTLKGWINELLTLADKAEVPKFAREAMRTIAAGINETKPKQFCKVCDGIGHGIKKHWGDFPKCEACNGTCYEDPSK